MSCTAIKQVSLHLQDLQSEIDTERDTLLSLTATSRKLLSNLESGSTVQGGGSGGGSAEDPAALQKRLEEMNQRWNFLKAKSVAIRWVRKCSCS